MPTFLADRTDLYTLGAEYPQSVLDVGGLPVLLPHHEPADAERVLEGFDGLILVGGDDIDPAAYGEPDEGVNKGVSASADASDLGFAAAAMRRRLPVFAICRGCQALNVAMGGTLRQDITAPGAVHPPISPDPAAVMGLRHPIVVAEDSRLAKAYGGLGASFADYCRISNEIARHAPATALAFNMHCVTMLLTGQIAGDLTFTSGELATLERRRRSLYGGVIDGGALHAQPFSEGNAPGATEGIATVAEPTEGGFVVSGRKVFASLSEAAQLHNIVARVPGDDRVRFIGVPAGAPGVSITGPWDPVGMRATLSRTLVFDHVSVPAEHEWLPAGGFDQAATRWPHFYLTLSFTYLGLMQAVLDETAGYLQRTGRVESSMKQHGWAQLRLRYEQARALQHAAADEAGVDPTPDAVWRAWAALVTVMDGAPEMASLGLRLAGGRALLKPEPLERLYRDARCGAVMLPWSVEVCLERLGRSGLVPDEGAPA
jgi:alkylation response protein AidB-like acyl-CoA dehydrogenase